MKIISLGPRFAAELRGVDLIDVATSDAAYRAVREAFEEHSVILFRNQEVSDDVAAAIEGMDDRRSRALLAKLIDEATQSRHVYLHRWRAGDVILSDNRATMHRGRPWPGTQARLMVRTTISARDIDGLDQVRPN